MRADRALERLGGVADTATLLRLTTRARLRVAVLRGRVVRDARGRYSLPGVDEAVRAAHRLSGLLAEDSAAQFHGWEMKHPPKSPCVVVPRNRNLTAERRAGVRVRYRGHDADDVRGVATGPVETVMWCAARMPFDEALAIADSALRHGDVTRGHLLAAAEGMADQHRARCRRVAEHADGRAANPFESVLRAIALEVAGLEVEPQRWVGQMRPDLVDRALGLVVEAESFEFHGRRKALRRDCERYNALVVVGWMVLRFAWEHVMHRPEYVRRVLEDAVAELSRPRPPRRRAEGTSPMPRAS